MIHARGPESNMFGIYVGMQSGCAPKIKKTRELFFSLSVVWMTRIYPPLISFVGGCELYIFRRGNLKTFSLVTATAAPKKEMQYDATFCDGFFFLYFVILLC
jgi:hypothetical protein